MPAGVASHIPSSLPLPEGNILKLGDAPLVMQIRLDADAGNQIVGVPYWPPGRTTGQGGIIARGPVGVGNNPNATRVFKIKRRIVRKR